MLHSRKPVTWAFDRHRGSGCPLTPATPESLALHHFPQRHHHRGGGFLLDQLRVVDLAGGVVQDHNQVMPTLILKPLVMAAVDMQHHARQWAPLPALAMHAALGLPLHQAGPLESLLHPGVAQSDPVFLAQLLVEMTHVQIEILLSIQFQNLLGLSESTPLDSQQRWYPV